MGLDIVLYDTNNNVLEVTEIEYTLHESLFHDNNIWRSYSSLKKLSNYYLTDVTFDRIGIDNLIQDLKHISIFMPMSKLEMMEKLIILLSDKKIKKVHIAGD